MHDVIEDGKLPTSIIFHIEPLGKLGTPCELKLGLIGEELNRALRLQKSGTAVVEVGPNWWVQRATTWQEEIIDLALMQFATIPASASI